MSQDRILGLLILVGGLIVALLWVPLDTETGIAERVRGRSAIGDALMPTFAGVLMALCGALLALADDKSTRLTFSNVSWIGQLLVCLTVSLVLMRYAGPIAASVLAEGGYRPLRDTVPWKYVGFLIGGTALILILVTLIEHGFRWSRLLIAFAVSVAIAAFYDLPFEDLLLPPNGDV